MTDEMPLSEKINVTWRPQEYSLGHDAQVLTMYAEGMPKFQIDNATQEITPYRIIKEVLKWVEGTHYSNITYRADRNEITKEAKRSHE